MSAPMPDPRLRAEDIVDRAGWKFLPAEPEWTAHIEPCCRAMVRDLARIDVAVRERTRAILTLEILPPERGLPTERILAAVFGSNGRAPTGTEETEPPRSRSLAEILADPDAQKPPAAVVPGLAWAGRLTLVAAREGVGKSTLFQAAAAAVTTGGEFLGTRCPQGTVLWVLVEEHQSDLVIRAVKFQTAPDALYVLERPAEPLVALRAEVSRLQPTLLIVDTLHRFASAIVTEGHAADQWGPLMDTLDGIARQTNAAILMSAQAVKATGDYRDSSAIGHGVDVVLNLVRPHKDSPVRRLEKQKARWALDDLQFELGPDGYRLGGVPAKKLTKQRKAVLDALEPPMTYTEWFEASDDVPESTFKRSIKFLGDQGYVRQGDDGAYVRNEGPQGPNEGHGPSGPNGSEGHEGQSGTTVLPAPSPSRGHFPPAPIGAGVAPTAGPMPTDLWAGVPLPPEPPDEGPDDYERDGIEGSGA